jgi:hypothetical protein
MAELESLGVRMAKVKAGVDTRPQDFIFQVLYIGKCVRSAGHTAVDRQPDVWGAEVQLQRFGECSGEAGVSGGKFRMVGCGAERKPGRIGEGFCVAVDIAIRDRSHRPPEPKVIFRVVATNETVGPGGPHHGEQSRALGSAEIALGSQLSKRGSVLTRSVLRPEECDLRLLWSSHGTVVGPENSAFVVVAYPAAAAEVVRSVLREELRGGAHGKRSHLPHPWGCGGQESGGSRNPNTGFRARRIGVGNVCSPAIVAAEQ